nr:uncharacterized protein LOC116433979 [Nomia melanderi]
MSAENLACEEHFRSQFDRDTVTGRYIVRLPFKDNVVKLGESQSVALKRFHSLERKLSKCPDVRREYETFMDEYLRLGHMSLLKTSPTEQGYYLPHHSVVKQSSLTTKLRVIFDASAKTSNGISLNDALLVGPTIQEDLFSILVRFRSHSYVMTADVEKMYRQILVHSKDRVYQKVLWRSNVCDPIKTYTLNTATNGTSAAPFLAIRTLHQLAADEGKEFSRAATIIREDFYVDDLLTGARTYDEAVIIRDELINICKRAGFKLRQWAANDERLTETLGDRTNNRLLRLDLDDTVKTLGLCWNAKHNMITYDIQELRQPNRVTKRTILSQTATLFDPLEILGPVIVRAKILLQSLWKLQLDWDESVPLDIHTQWSTYCRDLIQLKNLNIRRQITPKEYEMLQLHGFCDASEQAYGACIYIRGVDKHGKTSTQLIASKSRVAPIKTITLPRLELCAAHLLSKLYETVIGALRRLSFQKPIFWSDSTIVLHWIRTSPHLLKTFVSHRIADIQRLTQAHEWHHVQSADNPADLISCGSNVATLLNDHLWHHGPEWLGELEIEWPFNQLDLATKVPEMRPLVALHTQNGEFNLFERYSSYGKLNRVVAYILRFRFITSRKESQGRTLTATELREAEQCIVKCIQGRAYKNELHALGAGSLTTSLAPLNPFIDATGILRVGGRLSKAHIQPDMKHPILLPKDEHKTKLIIQEHHINSLHAGTQATLNNLQQKFWIPNGRNVVRRIIHRCTTCHRAKPPIASYKMSGLPASRLAEARPSLRAGVD